jgi:LPXTG-motif cell wall-anchored protein
VRFPKRALAACGALALTAGVIAGGGAQAASVPVTFNITGGTLSIGATSLPFPAGSAFNGTWDNVSGALAGTMTVPAFSVDITDPIPATIGIQVSQVGTATGNVNPTTGAATLAVTLNIALNNALLPVGCGIDGVSISLSSSAPGGAPLNFATGVLGLGATGFAVPGVNATCGALGPLVDGGLGIPTSTTAIVLTLQGPTNLGPPAETQPPATDETGNTVATTAPPATQPPATAAPTTAAPTVPPTIDVGGTLPPTGANDSTTAMTFAALAVLVLGGGLVMATRRRAVN